MLHIWYDALDFMLNKVYGARISNMGVLAQNAAGIQSGGTDDSGTIKIT
jgi:hypothetical protein